MNHCNKTLLIGFLIESFFFLFLIQNISSNQSNLDHRTTWAGRLCLAAHLIHPPAHTGANTSIIPCLSISKQQICNKNQENTV